jgi:hypothetical protein
MYENSQSVLPVCILKVIVIDGELTDHLFNLLPQILQDGFISIDRQNPFTGGHLYRPVFLHAETWPIGRKDLICIFPTDRYRVIIATRIEDDDLVNPVHRLKTIS